MKRVRAGQRFRYDPVGLDVWDSKAPDLKKGDVVVVAKLPGCPPPGTMGHCHVLKDGRFAGLVLVNSLVKLEGSENA